MGDWASLWRNRSMTTDVKMEMLESIVVTTVLYRSKGIEKKTMKMFDMKHLRKVLKLGVMHRIRNKDIRERCENKASFLERMDQST